MTLDYPPEVAALFRILSEQPGATTLAFVTGQLLARDDDLSQSLGAACAFVFSRDPDMQGLYWKFGGKPLAEKFRYLWLVMVNESAKAVPHAD